MKTSKYTIDNKNIHKFYDYLNDLIRNKKTLFLYQESGNVTIQYKKTNVNNVEILIYYKGKDFQGFRTFIIGNVLRNMQNYEITDKNSSLIINSNSFVLIPHYNKKNKL